MKRFGLVGVALITGLLTAYLKYGRERTTVDSSAPDSLDSGRRTTTPVRPSQFPALTTARDRLVQPSRGARPGGNTHLADAERGPTAPGYNAMRLYATGVANPDEIYWAEPRREPWASQRARDVVAYLGGDITAVDPVASVEADCRTSSCRVRVYSENPYLTSQFGGYPFGCWGTFTTGDIEMRDAAGRTYADLYVLFGDDTLEDAGFMAMRDQWCPAERRRFLDNAKQPYGRK